MSNRNRKPFKIKVSRTGNHSFSVTTVKMNGDTLVDPLIKHYTTQVVNIITEMSLNNETSWVTSIECRLNDYFSGLEYFQGVIVEDLRAA